DSMISLPSGSMFRSVRNRSMSSDSLDTQKLAASGPVISRSRGSGGVSSEMPMPGLMPPPMICDEAAEVEPMEPRLDEGYVREAPWSGLVETRPAEFSGMPGAGFERSK